MPPRPFPSRLSIGVDICDVRRVRAIISKSSRNFEHFLRRILTFREADTFSKRYGQSEAILSSSQADLRKVADHLASRWAAKEAVIKAVTWRKLTASDVQILSSKRVSSHRTEPPNALILDRPAPMSYQAAWDLAKKEEQDASDLFAESEKAPESNRGLTEDSAHSGPRIRRVPDPLPIRRVRDQRSATELDPIPLVRSIFNPDGQIAKLSISHDGDYAVATCLAHEPEA